MYHHRIKAYYRHWLWPAAIAAACLLAWWLPGHGVAALGWERGAVAAPWRLLTAHLVHLDAWHLGLNLAGLALVWALAGRAWRPLEWAALTLAVALAIGFGLFLVPDLAGYAGLSGVLHGMLAAGAAGLWRQWRVGAALIAALLLGKAIFEWALPGTAIAEAHWIGSVAGMAAGIMAVLLRRRTE